MIFKPARFRNGCRRADNHAACRPQAVDQTLLRQTKMKADDARLELQNHITHLCAKRRPDIRGKCRRINGELGIEGREAL